MRMIVRRFASSLAAAMAPLFALTSSMVYAAYRNEVDYRLSSGRKSTVGGRDRSRYTPHQGEREIARRRRQIAAGSLRVENGLAA